MSDFASLPREVNTSLEELLSGLSNFHTIRFSELYMNRFIHVKEKLASGRKETGVNHFSERPGQFQ